MTTSLHIIGSRFSGGAEMFFIRLVNALSETGHTVSTITRPRSMVSGELSAGIAQDHVGMYNVRDPFSRLLISRILKKRDPDIVQTYMGRATRLTKVPEGSHTIHVSRLGGFYKLDGYGHADAWVGNTRSICDYLIKYRFPADRVFHIPNFVDTGPPLSPGKLAQLRKDFGIPEDAFIVLGVGRLLEKKGFVHLVEAFSRLPLTLLGRRTHLLIAGSGPEENRLASLVSGLNLTGRVHMAGWQNDPGPCYQMADVFVCPSLHEPLGNVILEAWSHGVPVISTRTHGAVELIEEGINGLLVPCGDSEAISRTLQDLFLADEISAEELAREGRSMIGQKYTRDSVVGSYLELYDRLLEVGK